MELVHAKKPKKPGCRSTCKACRVEAAHANLNAKSAFQRPLTMDEASVIAKSEGFKNLTAKNNYVESKIRSANGLVHGRRSKEGELEL